MQKKTKIIGAGAIALIIVCIVIFTFIVNKSKGIDAPDINKANGIDAQSEVKLTFYFEGKENKNSREVLNEIENKTKNDLNVKLDFKYLSAESHDAYRDQLKTIIGSGQPCDAFYYNAGISGGLSGLQKDDLIMDISELFPQYAPNYFKMFSKDELRAATVNGKLLAIPNKMPASNRRCILVRDDLMKKYNIKEIKGYDDLEVYLQKVKENEKAICPMTYSDTTIGLFAEATGYVILDYFQGLVYKRDDPNMKILVWEQTPEFKEGIAQINSWYKSGYLLKGIGLSQIDNGTIATGKWGSIIAPLSSVQYVNAVIKSQTNFGWSYVPFELFPAASDRSNPIDGSLVISSKFGNAKRALMFIDRIESNQDNYDLFMYGINGKQYSLYGDQVNIPKDTNLSDAYISRVDRAAFMNITYERTVTSDSPDLKKWYMNEIENNTEYPKSMGFYPDYTSVQDIVNMRNRAFYTVEQNIYLETFKIGDVYTYIKDMEDEGVDKLVAEVQRQLDKWRTEQSK
jgi:putative aldouronate transport system substrate-binding protein